MSQLGQLFAYRLRSELEKKTSGEGDHLYERKNTY